LFESILVGAAQGDDAVASATFTCAYVRDASGDEVHLPPNRVGWTTILNLEESDVVVVECAQVRTLTNTTVTSCQRLALATCSIL
jgi:hypothetical protein